MDATAPIRDADLPLERDLFLRSLLRELAGTLESVVGIEEASGYISVVGAAIGEQIDTAYRDAIHVDRLNRDQVSAVLVDLKTQSRVTSTSWKRQRTGSSLATGVVPLEHSSRGGPRCA